MSHNEKAMDIERFLANEMNENERISFLNHIENCEECKKELEFRTIMLELMQEEESLPTDFHEDLMNKINNQTDRKVLDLNRRRKKTMAWLPFASVAAVAVLVFTGIKTWNYDEIIEKTSPNSSTKESIASTESIKEETEKTPEEASYSETPQVLSQDKATETEEKTQNKTEVKKQPTQKTEKMPEKESALMTAKIESADESAQENADTTPKKDSEGQTERTVMAKAFSLGKVYQLYNLEIKVSDREASIKSIQAIVDGYADAQIEIAGNDSINIDIPKESTEDLLKAIRELGEVTESNTEIELTDHYDQEMATLTQMESEVNQLKENEAANKAQIDLLNQKIKDTNQKIKEIENRSEKNQIKIVFNR